MTSKPKLNQPDVESTITSPIGESLNINFAIPSKQFEQVFEKDTNIEKRNLTIEEVKKEWEELGYEWLDIDGKIVLKQQIQYTNKYVNITINSVKKSYWKIVDDKLNFIPITLKEHQLLTKTFKALEKENE